MKYLLFSIALFLCVNITAQELAKKSKIFVRVYNSEGQKIAKGKILDITDDALTLKKWSKSITIPLKEISYIRTKRTKGHNLLIGGVTGALIPAIAYSGNDSGGWGTVAIVLLTPITGIIGTGIGYLTTVFKKSIYYSIQGDPLKWEGFMEDMYQPRS
jgi:hypothetical protein